MEMGTSLKILLLHVNMREFPALSREKALDKEMTEDEQRVSAMPVLPIIKMLSLSCLHSKLHYVIKILHPSLILFLALIQALDDTVQYQEGPG